MASFAATECFLPFQQLFLAPTHHRQGNGTSSTVVFLPRAAPAPHHSKSLSFSFSSQGTFILSAKIPYFTFLRKFVIISTKSISQERIPALLLRGRTDRPLHKRPPFGI
jgi:hypothetical protein